MGDPSQKLSGDAPRVGFTNLFFSQIVGPLVMVAVTLIPYLYINAQTGISNKPEPTNALIRIAIVAFAPIAVNAGVLGGLFGMACCMGPLLSMCCKKFGSVLAAIAHGVSVVMLFVFFEVMFFLEGWSFTKAVLGMIAVTMVQRFIYKLIISLALTREFKADSSNVAWWTGKWYSMGWHSISQPGREFLCKITELGFFSADFVLGHFLLFIMLPVLAIPYIDKFHSVMLFWLRPSRQIRPPIYSLKQSRLRKRRVVRFAILYFVILVLFVALLAGPLVASHLGINLPTIPMQLMQPTGQNNNDTKTIETGSALIPLNGGKTGAALTNLGSGAATSAAATTGGAKLRLF